MHPIHWLVAHGALWLLGGAAVLTAIWHESREQLNARLDQVRRDR